MHRRKILISIFLLCIFFAPSTFSRTLLKKKITTDSFERNVRPASKIILNEFYKLVEHLSSGQSEIVTLKSSLTDIQILWDSWLVHCSKDYTPECPQKLSNLQEALIRVEKLILGLEKKSFSLSKKIPSHEVDSKITTVTTLDSMSVEILKLLHNIEMIRLTSERPIPSKANFYSELSATIHFMRLESERILLGPLSDDLEVHFNAVWNHFLRDLELHVVIEGRANYFEQRVDDFNQNWNLFFAKMTSENFLLPEGTRIYLQTMHQTWNGILRQIIP